MDRQDLDDLNACMCCTNDVEALDYYLSGYEHWNDFADFVNSDENRTIDIIKNVIPKHYSPLENESQGVILAIQGETYDEINQREIKFISCYDPPYDDDPSIGWEYREVRVPSGTMCYCYTDDETDVTYIFTSSAISPVQE